MAAEPLESFPFSTVVDLVHYWSCHEAHRPAFIFYDKHRSRSELSYGQLYELGGRWAAVLQEGGVGRKERVVSTLPNGPERALCDVGIVMAGAVMVNAQCQLADGSDFLFTLRQSKASAVCVDPDNEVGPWRVLQKHVKYDPVTETVTYDSLPDLHKVFFIRRTGPLCLETDATNESNAGHSEPKSESGVKVGFSSPETGDFIANLQVMGTLCKAEVDPEDTVSIFNTSGSTGFSKLVPLSHARYLIFCNDFVAFTALDCCVIFSASPLGWLGGTLFCYMLPGKTRVLLDMWYGPPDDLADDVWNMIAQERCTGGILMPFLLSKILALEDRKQWMMNHIGTGGQPMKINMVRQALQLAEAVCIGYASTELGVIASTTVTGVSQYQDFLVGKPSRGNAVKICNSEGDEVPQGTKGEIYAKTTTMTEGYFNNEEDTLASFAADGFLKTGDIGVMLEDGSLLVEGRQHDAIHRGSYIFYPAWLESRIFNTCPDLQSVFVVGVPDPAMGEEICACFVPSDPSMTEERVRSLVEEDILTKVEDPLSPRPRYYLSFQAFPRTYTDKPQRKHVRRLAIAKLNLG